VWIHLSGAAIREIALVIFIDRLFYFCLINRTQSDTSMRLRIKDGRWFETTTAIRINVRLWYTSRGNWVFHRYAEPDFIEESEAVRLLLADGNWFEDHPGFEQLAEHVKEQLFSHLNDEYSPGDEV